ncbi:hypothetical protein MMC29_002367 [Sticta canariensis]|nr:hypothetical protein [Sticta canariensis]
MIPLLTFLAILWQYISNSPGLTIGTIIVGPLVGNMIYNRYFHPLRHFPGPFWASVSDFWKLYFCLTKETHTRGIKLHDRYGPVVRLAPNLLAFNDPKLLPIVYHKNVDKTDFYSTGILGEIAPPFQTLNHKEHAEKKKRIAFAFSLSNLKKFEGEVDKALMQFDVVLKEKFAKPSKRLDIAEWVK